MGCSYSKTQTRRMTETTDYQPLLSSIAFNDRGLVPAIAQQHDTGEVLMMAWMNEAAFIETVTTGRVCYWSRSRQKLWRKGETSGHVQKLIEARVDCDGDTVLVLVDQTGVACHTGTRTCFFRHSEGGAWAESDEGYQPPLTDG